ncbi:MAG: hypothetical protein WDO15_01635 [Bacteroidota bacterium]
MVYDYAWCVDRFEQHWFYHIAHGARSPTVHSIHQSFSDLTASPVKPWPLEQWRSIAGQNSKDDMAKIAAQALYGKSFVPSNGFIHQADEFITRFSFATLAADMSATCRYSTRTSLR